MEVAKQYLLLVFCDASMKAYATAIYLRIEEQNSVNVNLMFSKMRLVSRGTNKKRLKKDITLPRLELFAVTIGIRAANFVASELKITSLKRVLWTDSTCVLHWLKPVNRCQLVENRIKEILKETDVTFRYVPSNENLADFNRKDCLMRQLGLRIDELGILRCCGCFLNVEVKESSKSPKLLPRHERFTRLLIMEVHE